MNPAQAFQDLRDQLAASSLHMFVTCRNAGGHFCLGGSPEQTHIKVEIVRAVPNPDGSFAMQGVEAVVLEAQATHSGPDGTVLDLPASCLEPVAALVARTLKAI